MRLFICAFCVQRLELLSECLAFERTGVRLYEALLNKCQTLGILQVLTDPRSSLAQCLQVMLTAELTDNDGWELLIKPAENLGYDDMKAEFETRARRGASR
jgi:hypothetical protein